LDLETYWNLTPTQFRKYLKIYNEKEKERAREADALNHNLGIYIAIAFNNPKRYPKRPFMYEKEIEEKKVMTAEEMLNILKRKTLILGGDIKYGHN